MMGWVKRWLITWRYHAPQHADDGEAEREPQLVHNGAYRMAEGCSTTTPHGTSGSGLPSPHTYPVFVGVVPWTNAGRVDCGLHELLNQGTVGKRQPFEDETGVIGRNQLPCGLTTYARPL